MIQFGAGLLGGVVLSLVALWLASLGMRVRIGNGSVDQFSRWREVMRQPVKRETT